MAQTRRNLTDRRVAAETDGGSREAEKRRAAALRKQREAQQRQAQRDAVHAQKAQQEAELERRRQAAAARQRAQREQLENARKAQAASARSQPQRPQQSARPVRPQQRPESTAGQRSQQTQQRAVIRQEPFLHVGDYPRNGKPSKRRRRRRYPVNSPAAIKRQKRLQRRLAMFCVALAAVALAILFSTDVLFKVVNIRVETMERTVPANTGIYQESEIIAAADIEEGVALFSVNPKKVREQLLVNLPYLEDVQVRFSLPTTVEIQVEPAVENLYVRSGTSYAVLSRTFRVLKLDSTRPEGLVELRARVDGTPQVGYSLAFAQVDEEKDEEATAQAKEENQSLAETLETIVGYLQQEGIYPHVTQINLRDMADITLIFRDRVTVQMGTINNMDYKCRMLGVLMRNDDGNGINENDRGTLDVSRCASTKKAYFTPE